MIAIGSDHGGYKLKEEIKKYFDEKGIEYRDFGTDSEERTDYPIYAKKVAQAVQSKECEGGILLCRSGYGMTVVANKFKGIRAASISNEEAAKFAKADDDIKEQHRKPDGTARAAFGLLAAAAEQRSLERGKLDF